MSNVTIFVVVQIGLRDDAEFGIIRGDPWKSNEGGLDLTACIIGLPVSAMLLGINASPTGLPANPTVMDYAKAVQAEVLNATNASGTACDIDITSQPVYSRHCWLNGGWSPDCGFSYAFEVQQRNIHNVLIQYSPDIGYLNGLPLRTRFLAVIQGS